MVKIDLPPRRFWDAMPGRDGTELSPLTGDPTRSLSVCFELRDHFDNGVLLANVL